MNCTVRRGLSMCAILEWERLFCFGGPITSLRRSHNVRPGRATHSRMHWIAPMQAPIMRIAVSIVLGLCTLAAAPAALATPPTPPCPQVEGWTPEGTVGPIDNGNGVQFECVYALPGHPEQLTLNLHWYKPTAREVDVDYSECGRGSSGGTYYTTIYSGKGLVYEEYIVNAGPEADNIAVFKAEQQRIQTAAYTLLEATETLAKSCTRSESPVPAEPTPAAPPSHDTTRPVVHVHSVTGRAGRSFAFRFTVSDDSGYATIVMTIYRGSSTRPVMRHNYGRAKAPPTGDSYAPTIHARSRGRFRWCITATDTSGNTSKACSSLVVR